jgi:hypothetical protein
VGSAVIHLEDNWVHNNRDEGIHMSGGSHNNIVRNVGGFVSVWGANARKIEDNVEENLYVLDSYDNQFTNLQIEGGGGTGAASVQIESSYDNVLTGNTFKDRRVQVIGLGAEGNCFGTLNSVGGCVSATNEWQDCQLRFENGGDNNEALGVTITNPGAPCVLFRNGDGNVVSGTLTCPCQLRADQGGINLYDRENVNPCPTGDVTSPSQLLVIRPACAPLPCP